MLLESSNKIILFLSPATDASNPNFGLSWTMFGILPSCLVQAVQTNTWFLLVLVVR